MLRALVSRSGVVALVLAGALTVPARAQQPTRRPLVVDGVTVVDVVQGKLVPNQRVVLVGNRIQAVGDSRTVQLPTGAQVVDARGKYLIPGLWDMHVHVLNSPETYAAWAIAQGVTGIRDMGKSAPLERMLSWRREVAAGSQIGPRAVVTGPIVAEIPMPGHASPRSPEGGRRIVDSLQAAGADFIKVYSYLSPNVYYAIAAEARQRGIPFAGHVPMFMQEGDASDSGQRSVEHVVLGGPAGMSMTSPICRQSDSLNEARCAELAKKFVRNGTWWVPTLSIYEGEQYPTQDFAIQVTARLHRVGMPLLAGTDGAPPGAGVPMKTIHQELALLVKAGLTPLEALQTATLNPAKFLRMTDSLGTVAPGKLADLVLLDADPLADITNTKTTRAVVANGRYLDRTALDQLLKQP